MVLRLAALLALFFPAALLGASSAQAFPGVFCGPGAVGCGGPLPYGSGPYGYNGQPCLPNMPRGFAGCSYSMTPYGGVAMLPY